MLDQPLQGGRDLTPAVRATPRERLWCRALYGHWDRFPVSPAAAHDEFTETVKRVRAVAAAPGASCRRSSVACTTRTAGAGRPCPAAGAVAWAAHRRDRGARRGPRQRRELAGFLGESLATYARLPWQRSGIDAQVYFTDLCEVCVWENHGLLYQRETAPFASVAVEHRDLVEALLWSLAAELRGHRLGYPAEVAMALVAYLQAGWTAWSPPPSARARTSGCPSSRWPRPPGRRTARPRA